MKKYNEEILNKIKISDEQALEFALFIKDDIEPYVIAHKKEFKEWLKIERKRTKRPHIS